MSKPEVADRPIGLPRKALAARKRYAAQRLEERAAQYRAEADELEAEADRIAAS